MDKKSSLKTNDNDNIKKTKFIKQEVCLNGSDISNTYEIYGSDVYINFCPDSSTDPVGSNKVKVKPIVNFDWESKFYFGDLISIHQNQVYLAYVLKSQSGGNVRITNRKNGERILLREFTNHITDIAFAYSQRIILGVVDDVGAFYAYEILENLGKLESILLLKIVRPKNTRISDEHLLRWCNFIPDEDFLDADDVLLLFLSHPDRAELWYIDLIFKEQAPSFIIHDFHKEYCHLLKDFTKTIVAAEFSPDATAIATASLDGNVLFYQINLDDRIISKSIYSWTPHDGQPLSFLKFLDDHKNHSNESQFWKFALTGCHNNCELKLWSCHSWNCLQKISFNCPGISPSLSTNSQSPLTTNYGATFKAVVDLGSLFIVLTHITKPVIYVLSLKREYDSVDCTNTRIQYVSEFPLMQPALSIAMIDARTRLSSLAKSIEDNVGEDESDGESSDENNEAKISKKGNSPLSAHVQIQLFSIQTRSLQEMSIKFHTSIGSANDHCTSISSPSEITTGGMDNFSDTSFSNNVSKMSQSMTNEDWFKQMGTFKNHSSLIEAHSLENNINIQDTKNEEYTSNSSNQNGSLKLSKIEMSNGDGHELAINSKQPFLLGPDAFISPKSTEELKNVSYQSSFSSPSLLPQPSLLRLSPSSMAALTLPQYKTLSPPNDPPLRNHNDVNEKNVENALLNRDLEKHGSSGYFMSSEKEEKNLLTGLPDIANSLVNSNKTNNNLDLGGILLGVHKTSQGIDIDSFLTQSLWNTVSNIDSIVPQSISPDINLSEMEVKKQEGFYEADEECSDGGASLEIVDIFKGQNIVDDFNEEKFVNEKFKSLNENSAICDISIGRDGSVNMINNSFNKKQEESCLINNRDGIKINSEVISTIEKITNTISHHMQQIEFNTNNLLLFHNKLQLLENKISATINNKKFCSSQSISEINNYMEKLQRKQEIIIENAIDRINCAWSKKIHTDLQQTITTELMIKLLPKMEASMNTMKTRMQEELNQRLSNVDTLLKSGVIKYFKSKSSTNILSNAICGEMKNSMGVLQKEIICPGFDQTCNNMMQHLNTTFLQGSEQYLKSICTSTEKLNEAFLSQIFPFQSNLDLITTKMNSIEITCCEKDEEVHRQLILLKDSVNNFASNICANKNEDLQKSLSSAFENLQSNITLDIKKMMTAQLAAHHEKQQNMIKQQLNIARMITQSPSSLGSTATPLVTDFLLKKQQITTLIQRLQFNEAFESALSAANISLVEYVCESTEKMKGWNEMEWPLNQSVTLSLIQQLSASLNDKTLFKFKFLKNAIGALNKNDSITLEYIPTVIGQLLSKLNQMKLTNPSDDVTNDIFYLTKRSQLLLKISNDKKSC